MGELIIGQATDTSATLWVRGARLQREACVTLSVNGAAAQRGPPVSLRAARDYTGVVPVSGLEAGTRYTVTARFAATRRLLDGNRGARDGAQGEFRTFPKPDAPAGCSFLHGSCNLSIVSLTNLAALALGGIGTWAASGALERLTHRGDGGPFEWLGGLARRLRVPGLPWPLFWLLRKATGFEQARPGLPSPFKALSDLLASGTPDAPEFMIHAGDQIYFDFPVPNRAPDPAAYRRAYRQAWFEDPALRRLLAQCPHYMTLDDHEIVDSFANDWIPPWAIPGSGRCASNGRKRDREPADFLAPATKAYREYVHSRQPDPYGGDALFYRFQHGATHFFVLDTRTQRFLGHQEMIAWSQMAQLETWLDQHRDELKFIVSSVPFVAQVRPSEGGRRAARNRDASVYPWRDEAADKWSGGPFAPQRDEIIEFLHEQQIGRLVFLVGDMHCSYHAAMRVGRPEKRVTVHELAGGPIYQLQFAHRDELYDQYRGATRRSGVPYATWLRWIHGTSSGVLHVTASPDGSEVRWKHVGTSPRFESIKRSGSALAWSGRIRM